MHKTVSPSSLGPQVGLAGGDVFLISEVQNTGKRFSAAPQEGRAYLVFLPVKHHSIICSFQTQGAHTGRIAVIDGLRHQRQNACPVLRKPPGSFEEILPAGPGAVRCGGGGCSSQGGKKAAARGGLGPRSSCRGRTAENKRL